MHCDKCKIEMSKQGTPLHSGNSHYQQFRCPTCHTTGMRALGLVGGMPK